LLHPESRKRPIIFRGAQKTTQFGLLATRGLPLSIIELPKRYLIVQINHINLPKTNNQEKRHFLINSCSAAIYSKTKKVNGMIGTEFAY